MGIFAAAGFRPTLAMVATRKDSGGSQTEAQVSTRAQVRLARDLHRFAARQCAFGGSDELQQRTST